MVQDRLPEDLDPPEDPLSVARSICLRLLTQRARTRDELAHALRKRNVPDEVAVTVLNRFSEVGLIDDRAVAESFALARLRDRGMARTAIAAELRRRGLADDTVREAVAQIDVAAETNAARSLVERKLHSLAALPPEVQARRLVGLLARRGYPAGMAYRVVREALAEHGSTLNSAEIDDSGD